VAFSLDESVMGFAFPKEERVALVASEPHKFQMPSTSEMRFNLLQHGPPVALTDYAYLVTAVAGATASYLAKVQGLIWDRV
jgi:hypothetical protein